MERQAIGKTQKSPVPHGGVPHQSGRSSLPTHPLIHLQRSIGNRAVQHLINSPYIQTKLQVSTPGDPFEEEADRVADTVMRMPDPSRIQRKCDECEEETLQRKTAEGDEIHVTDRIEAQVNSLRGGGQPLPESLRAHFEPRFGHDFSDVRLHTGARAAEAARSINAQAFTFGQHVAFGSGQYSPETSSGQRLLAHELTHVVQQSGRAPSTISRAPQTGTDRIHSELIEQYRRAHGLPPRGIDQVTGQQVGPTDSEIRFGGLLEAWLRAQSQAQSPTSTPAPTVRNVPAPAQAPTIIGPGTTSVVAGCASAPDVGACRQHRTYVENILPQAIANIRNVPSPYSAAIASLYTAALPAAQRVAPPIPAGSPNAPHGRSSDATAGPVTVTFGAITFTFRQFTISLQQQGGALNGRALGIGGPIAFVFLNEDSNDALGRNLAGVEATIIHETMHIFMEIVEAQNRARTTGAPVNPNMDRTSYAAQKTSLESALLPFVTQIRQLPSFTGSPASGTPQSDAAATADTFLSETIARTEAGIFAKQRAGQAFGAADLRALPPFFRSSEYWSPTPPVDQELKNYIRLNQTQIDAAIQPIIWQVGERYLNLRP